MEPRRINIQREVHQGSGAKGLFLLADVIAGLDRLIETHEGKIKLVYLDPPFMTGDRFVMRVRVGENEWKSGRVRLNWRPLRIHRTVRPSLK